MRVLIVEDNVKTANFLSKGLKEHYFLPDIALNGQEGLFLANEHSYDVMILDILLPCLDGWDLVQLIRKKNKQILILFLTACDGVEDKVKGLALGADDYLVKPFSFSELLARIQSLTRRRDQQQGIYEWISVADLKVDLLKNRVTRSELPIALTGKEYMLLVLMAKHQGHVLSRTFMAEQVWDIHFDSDSNVIDVAIKRLRAKIDQSFNHKLIHTVRGIGYVLEVRS